MIDDFREASDPALYQADVCIVGAGPAGLAIAGALAGSRHRVCVIESGGLRCETDTQQLHDGDSIGEAGLNPAHSRLRVYGGSCRLWGGGCIPFSPAEFEPRDWVPNSGWPIRYQDLEPWYRKAEDVCRLPQARAAGGFHRHRPGRRQQVFESPDLSNRALALSPIEFGRSSLPLLTHASNVQVLLHANLLELRAVSDAQSVQEASIGALNGRRATVRARFYVLASGGIENARLLLLSDSQVPGGLGNHRDLVGRYFQDHPRCRLGTMDQGRLDPLLRTYGRPEGAASHLELCLSEQAQRAHRLLACRARPFAFYAPPSPGMQALRELRACLSRPQRHDADEGLQVERDVTQALDRGLPTALAAPDRSQVRPVRAMLRAGIHAGDAAAGALRRISGRSHLRRERVDVMGYFEQAPNPLSRITLDERRDALDQRRVKVDWRMSTLDRNTHRAAAGLFGNRLAQACGSRFEPDAWIQDPEGVPDIQGTAHHLGTTRMADSPEDGVVDSNCRVHGIDNLYVAGSSVFPTGAWAFPTFTIIALSLRLAERLRSRLDMVGLLGI